MTSAILNDGTRVQCMQAQVGDVRIETPWGRRVDLSTPVLAVEDLNNETLVLTILKKNDYALWVKHASERGMISVLLEAVEQEVDTEKKIQAQYKALNLLETWGRRLDPLPERTPAKKRLDALWKKLSSASIGEAALLSGRLQFLIDGPSATPMQRIGLADLRRGLRHRRAGPRWSSVSLGSWQQEEDLWWLTGETSLKDDSFLVAQRAAEALLALGLAVAGALQQVRQHLRLEVRRRGAPEGAVAAVVAAEVAVGGRRVLLQHGAQARHARPSLDRRGVARRTGLLVLFLLLRLRALQRPQRLRALQCPLRV